MYFLEIIENDTKTMFHLQQLVNVVGAGDGGAVIVIKMDDGYHNISIKENYEQVYEQIKTMLLRKNPIVTVTRVEQDIPNNVVNISSVQSIDT